VRISVRTKFAIALFVAFAWTMFSIWVSDRWKIDLGAATHPLFALVAVTFVAYVPGFMNAFLVTSLLLDRRPPRAPQPFYPGVTVLIAAYQEEEAIAHTLASLANEDYLGAIEILVLSDGSTDRTVKFAEAASKRLIFSPSTTVRVLDFPANRGKSVVLNEGLREASHGLIVTIDGDSHLRQDALTDIVERLLSDPPETAAVAGAVLVRNARRNLITGAQEWDYFHGIAAVKRMQSMYHGTLVAQGAFSIYRREALEAVGGWPECVGEDIVLTWALLKKDYRIGYAEDAVVFTNAPTTFRQFALQRKRWSRGMIEALHHHEDLLFKRRMSTMFIWWNLLFLPLDLAFTFIFIPGIIAAIFFGIYWIAGPLTLAVLPLAGLWNIVIYRVQTRMVRKQGIELRHNFGGLFFYLFVYTLAMQPVCVWGYVAEMMGRTKKWGTK
ncbi:MAG TPA: glycosyltransferase, partial [Allosphingosinicella sp.]|uniref:glycosyltransferase n=1 Tax=Allosphingosinicella sp. TaxID=2823234 RepID=UPI002EDA06BA